MSEQHGKHGGVIDDIIQRSSMYKRDVNNVGSRNGEDDDIIKGGVTCMSET